MPINHVVLASGAVVAVSVAVATVIAIYESPELRQYADDVRRRIAMAFYTMGDNFNSQAGQPRFNRPEDAEGFFESRRGQGAEPGVDADEETRRKQREELIYWNSVRLEKEKEKEKDNEKKNEQSQRDEAATSDTPDTMSRPRLASRGSTFDDFLRPDENAESGTYVFNTGADVRDNVDGLRRRGDGARGFVTSLYANPFADEHHIGDDEIEMEVGRQFYHQFPVEDASDIYSATTRDPEERATPTLGRSSRLIDVAAASASASAVAELPPTLERELAENEFMSAGQEDRHEAYASIQAWAHDSSRDFYSPLPVTPVAPVSEPEMISVGQLTPTDSVSLVGSGEDIATEAAMSEHDENGRYYDVISESDSEGMATPASWSEVGSVMSDSDAPLHASAAYGQTPF